MADQPTLKTEECQGVTVVDFGEASVLDTTTTQRIGRELYDLVENSGKTKIVLDFTRIRFLSSQALGVLLTLRRKADKAGVQIALTQIRPELVRIFEITNLDKLFGFFENRQDAIASLSEA